METCHSSHRSFFLSPVLTLHSFLSFFLYFLLLSRFKILKASIPFGVAYHHAGLTGEERKVIEAGFRSGQLHRKTAIRHLSDFFSADSPSSNRLLLLLDLFLMFLPHYLYYIYNINISSSVFLSPLLSSLFFFSPTLLISSLLHQFFLPVNSTFSIPLSSYLLHCFFLHLSFRQIFLCPPD